MSKASVLPNFKPIFDYIDQAIKPLATRDDINHLPSKKEFYEVMDKVAGELKAIRENQDAATLILQNYEDRIDNVETKLHISAN